MSFNFQLYDKFGAVIVIYKGINPEIVPTFVVKKNEDKFVPMLNLSRVMKICGE
jgi:hypothetical protein